MHPGYVPKNHPHQQQSRGADDSVDDRETPRDVFEDFFRRSVGSEEWRERYVPLLS